MKCNTHSPRGKQTGGLNELLEPTQCSQSKLPACQNSQRSPWGAISHAAHCQNRRVFSSHFPHPGRAAYSRISAVSTSSCTSENWKNNIISLHQTSSHNKARPVAHTPREWLHYSLTHLFRALHTQQRTQKCTQDNPPQSPWIGLAGYRAPCRHRGSSAPGVFLPADLLLLHYVRYTSVQLTLGNSCGSLEDLGIETQLNERSPQELT